MTHRCLYLVSSSANREYVVDCLEALALPRGMIHHFRYLIRYLDDRLRKALPSMPGRLPAALQSLPVVVVYMYQEQTGGVWRQAAGSYLPLRCGRLIEAFLEGEVAHFYFEVTDYVRSTIRKVTPRVLLNRNIRFRTTGGKNFHTSYAHLAEDLSLGAPSTRDAISFQKFVA